MKFRSMYTKILLSFLVVLIITEILVFFLFIMIPARHFTARFEQFAKTKVLVVKEMVEDKVRSVPAADWSENGPLREFISDFGKLLGAPVWVTRKDGTVALKSFSGEIPDLPETSTKDRPGRQGVLALRPLRGFDFYTTVPIELSGTEGRSNPHTIQETGLFSTQGFFRPGTAHNRHHRRPVRHPCFPAYHETYQEAPRVCHSHCRRRPLPQGRHQG